VQRRETLLQTDNDSRINERTNESLMMPAEFSNINIYNPVDTENQTPENPTENLNSFEDVSFDTETP
jgi:hypothetical protein